MKSNEPKRIWDNCVAVGEVMRSERTKLKVELVARDGIKFVNIRDWYKKKSDETWKPGLAGIAIPIYLPIGGSLGLPAKELMQLISQAIGMSEEFPIEDAANAVYAMPKVGD